MKKFFILFAIALTLFSLPRSAFAHATPLACLPRMGITVTQPPAQVICQFSEPLNPDKASLIVTDANGQRVDKNDTRLYENDDHTLVVSLDTTKMPQGIYTVQWQVQDTLDEGVTTSTFQFGVNSVVPPTPTAVLPGVPMTPTPIAPTNNATTDLISRFLIGAAVVVLAAMGVLFWRMRASGTADSE